MQDIRKGSTPEDKGTWAEVVREYTKQYPPLLTQKTIQKMTGLSASALEQARVYGKGIPFVRMGRSIRYRLDDVLEYLENLPRYRSTTQADAGK